MNILKEEIIHCQFPDIVKESYPDPDLGPLFGAITSKHESWETESHPDPDFGPRFGANMIIKLLQKIHLLFF